MKNVLITGGLGFIGSNLAHKLANEGHKITLLSKTDNKRTNIQGIEEKVSLILKDSRDIGKEDVKGMDWIFHCASTVDNYNIKDAPFKDIEVNCNGTLALLEACRHNNSQARIIYPSTFFVNGNLKVLPSTPDSPCNPMGLYPATRLAGEHFCKIYNEVFDMNSVIARFTNVFGIREQNDNKKKAAFNMMINTILHGGEIPLYNGGVVKRDYTYISDVVDACEIIARKGKRGEIYYVGRGEGISLKDMTNMMIKESGKGTIKFISTPEFHKQVGIGDYYCDNSPLKELGWEPKISIREGIRLTMEFYKK